MHLTSVILVAWPVVGMHLTGLHLTDLHLTGLHLTGLHLTGMHVAGVHLTGIHLLQACISRRHVPDKPSNCVPVQGQSPSPSSCIAPGASEEA
jgi:hypothetical protein